MNLKLWELPFFKSEIKREASNQNLCILWQAFSSDALIPTIGVDTTENGREVPSGKLDHYIFEAEHKAEHKEGKDKKGAHCERAVEKCGLPTFLPTGYSPGWNEPLC